MIDLAQPKAGQLFGFRETDDTQIYEFFEIGSDGSLAFRQRVGDAFRRRIIKRDVYDDMLSQGVLFRVAVAKGNLVVEAFLGDLLLDPTEKGITFEEVLRRKRAANHVREALTLQFYCIKWDESSVQSRGDVGLRFLIDSWREEAVAEGHDWAVSTSAVRRALNEYGEPGHRPLVAFLARGKRDPAERWPTEILKAWHEAVKEYWSRRATSKGDTLARFKELLGEARADAAKAGRELGEGPKDPTLYAWLKASGNYEYYHSKYGKKAADARFKGRKRGRTADQPLQFVLFDHTVVDVWAALYDDDGVRITEFRPTLTLAVDVRTRMVLGAVLTYESESLYAVLACLREVIRKKSLLISQYGLCKGATDGFGKPDCVIVDNAWQLSGVAFQSICALAGINVRWAPVETPTYKAIVERAIGTLNTLLWHRLDCGIPYNGPKMAALRLDPRRFAEEDLEQLQERLWRVIVTIYHLEVHDGIGMAPAMKWSNEIGPWRSTVDDVRTLDKLMGRPVTCLLTAEGVRFNGHRFHDPDVTTRLLDSMLRLGSVRRQRRSAHATGTVEVRATVDTHDCSAIEIWDSVKKKSVRLPNWNKRYSRGCTWQAAKVIKEFAEKRNMAFHTDEEKTRARAENRRSLPERIKAQPRKGRGALIAVHQSEAKAALMDGHVEEAFEEPTTSGMGQPIKHSLPAKERRDNLTMPRGQKRGGTKSKAKGKGRKVAARAEVAGPSIGAPASAVAPAATRVQEERSMPRRSEHLRPSPARARLMGLVDAED